MSDRLMVDLAPDARVSVSRWLDGEDPGPASEPFDLTWALDAEALEDVRWYLQDYLRAPYGVYAFSASRCPRLGALREVLTR